MLDACGARPAEDPEAKQKVASEALRWMLTSCKRIAQDKISRESLSALYIGDHKAYFSAPTQYAADQIVYGVLNHGAGADPLFSIVADLKPSLNFSQDELESLVDADEFWERRMELIEHIAKQASKDEGLKYTLLAYDPRADVETTTASGLACAIRPSLVMQDFEAGEMTLGYLATPHHSNTLDLNEGAFSALLQQYLVRLDHCI